jgi:hypothetical protein
MHCAISFKTVIASCDCRNGGNLGGDDHGLFMDGPRWLRYRQTKLANMLFTYALHDRLQVPIVVARRRIYTSDPKRA